MNKLSYGVIVLTIGMIGVAHAGRVENNQVPGLGYVGERGNSSADHAGTNTNFTAQNGINTALQKGINDNAADIQGIKDSQQSVQQQADSASASATNAQLAAGKSQEAASKAQEAAAQSATSSQEAIAKAMEVGNQYAAANQNMEIAAQKATEAKAEAVANTARVGEAEKNIETYKNETTAHINQFETNVNTRVADFEGNVNTRVDTIHNEVGEVKASIQGAIQDSASALIKSTHAEEVATQANLTATRVEAGLAQEIVDRKADVERGVSEAKAYTDEKFKDFDNKIAETKKFAAAGAASALAASQIPQVSQGSAFSLGLGLGNYAGQSALGIGMSARLGDYTVTKIAFTSDTMNQVSTGVGIAVEW